MSGAGASAKGTRKRRRGNNMPSVPQNTAIATVVGAVVGANVGGPAGAFMGIALANAFLKWSNGRDRKRAKHGHNTSRDAALARQVQRDWDQEDSLCRSEQVLSDHKLAKRMARADEKSPADGGHHAGARSVGRASSGRGDLARDKHGHAAKRQRVRDIDMPARGRSVHVCIMTYTGLVLLLNHTKYGKWQWPGGKSAKHEKQNTATKIHEVGFREADEELGTESGWRKEIRDRLLRLKDDPTTKMQVVSESDRFVNMAVLMPPDTCETREDLMKYFGLPGRNASIHDQMYNTRLSDEHQGYCIVPLTDFKVDNPFVKVDGAHTYIEMQCKHMYSSATLHELQRMHEQLIPWASLPGRG
tara:strand:+ start:901 stop:1977 length:1077 start_codon:yes stop_codon:yes gene_type:complete